MENKTKRAIEMIESCLKQLKDLEKEEIQENLTLKSIKEMVVSMNNDLNEIKRAII